MTAVLQTPGNPVAQLVKYCLSWVGVILACVFTPRRHYIEFFKRTPKFAEPPNRLGEVAVLTGGTRGIGFNVLRKLLQSKFHVVIGCRSLVAGEEVVARIRASGIKTGSTKVLELDLKSLKSVRRFAENVLKDSPRIDVLINNAGIMFGPYELTEDGYETQFQVNYLSHFLLTYLLLGKIKETSKRSDKNVACRIVNVSSDANYGGDLDFSDLEKCKVYAPNKSYSDSKLCQIIHSNYLDKLMSSSEEGVKVNAYSLHPGIIPSELWDHVPKFVMIPINLLRKFFRTVDEGADTVLYAALSSNLEGIGGSYINSGEIFEPMYQAKDANLQKKLWERSLQLVNLSS